MTEPTTTDTPDVRDLTEMLDNSDHDLLIALAQDIAQTRLTAERAFAQTTWICQMMTAIQATLPPPMQQALTAAFQQMATQAATENSHGG